MLHALEAERQRRAGAAVVPDRESQLVEFLARPDIERHGMRRIGPNRKVRYLTVVIPDPDATDEEIQQALESLNRHRES